jgi:hypothetical protein
MKTHFYLLFLLLIPSLASFGQGYSMKMISNVIGMPGSEDKMKMEYLMLVKNNGDKKIQITTKDYTMTNSYIGDSVYLDRKEKGYNDLCARGTLKEFNEANNNNGSKAAEIKDVKIEKLSDTMTIAGYKCKKARVSYRTTGMISMNIENVIWYTDQIKMDSNYFDTNTAQQENDYTKAMKELGTALKTVSKGFGGTSVVVEVTEIGKQDITVKDLAVIMTCKKPVTFKKYNKQINRREMAKMQSQMRQDNRNRGWRGY